MTASEKASTPAETGDKASGGRDWCSWERIRRLPADGLILMVRLYQVCLSPHLGGQCRFTPTCSNYFIDAVRKRGALVGAAKGFWRILRCNPFGGRGYDPVE